MMNQSIEISYLRISKAQNEQYFTMSIQQQKTPYNLNHFLLLPLSLPMNPALFVEILQVLTAQFLMNYTENDSS